MAAPLKPLNGTEPAYVRIADARAAQRFLQGLRLHRGIAQHQLAAAGHLERTAVTKWENRQRAMTVDTLAVWADLLGVEIVLVPKGAKP
jgi:transcriptional regulator with XRE-family HTH domain